jgi:hypothetical protein
VASLARPDRSARTQSVVGAMPVGPRAPSKSQADTLLPAHFRSSGLSDVGGGRHAGGACLALRLAGDRGGRLGRRARGGPLGAESLNLVPVGGAKP